MIVKDNWYEDFFHGIALEFWDGVVSSDWTKAETQFLIEKFAIAKGTHILDIPCGNGRHSIELAKHGYNLTSVDISSQYINRLKETAVRETLPINALESDMLRLQFTQVFDGAFCFGNSFGYFTYDRMQEFVGKISAALKPKARFIIHSGMLAESIIPHFREREWYSVGEIHMLIENSYNTVASCLETRLTFIRGNHQEKRAFKHYVYTLSEIIRLLQSVGLQTIGRYSSTDGTEYRFGSPQIYLAAEKD